MDMYAQCDQALTHSGAPHSKCCKQPTQEVCLPQAGAPLPPLPAEAERLFPDAADAVDFDRRAGQRAALLAVGAAQASCLSKPRV